MKHAHRHTRHTPVTASYRLLTLFLALCLWLPFQHRTVHAQPSAASSPPGIRADQVQVNHQKMEIVSKRTRTSRLFTQDGHYVAQIGASSLNYQDSTGQWQPIDSTLVPVALLPAGLTGSYVVNHANRFTVYFPTDLSRPIRLESGAASIQFALTGATAAGTVNGNTITYTLPGGTLSYAVGGDVVKESITLTSPTSPSTYTFSFQTSGVSPRQNPSGSTDFLTAAGTSLITMAAPVMDDAKMGHGRSRAVHLTLGAGTLTLAADPAWLKDPARTYPVTIDPTYSFATTQDCGIYTGDPNANYCAPNHTNEAIGYDGSTNRSLLWFNVNSVIPTSAQVLNAELGMYMYYQSGTTSPSQVISVNSITRNWTTGVTWNTTDGTTPWTTPGGDYTGTDSVDNGAETTTLGWVKWYPTQMVQDWVNASLPNFGILLKQTTQYNNVQYFYSTESAYNPPYLQVSYSLATGSQSWYPMTSQTLSDRLSLGVNVANGNLLVQTPLFSMPGIGIPLSMGLVYNSMGSQGPSAPNGLGSAQWRLTTGNDLFLSSYGNGWASITMPDGAQFLFKSLSGGAFTSPPGIEATLQWTGTNFTLTMHHGGLKFNFTSNGLLSSESDQDGNTLNFNYVSNGLVSSIQDTQNRLTVFHYSPSWLLTSIDDPGARSSYFTYDGANRLSGVATGWTSGGSGAAVTGARFAYGAQADCSTCYLELFDGNGNQTRIIDDAYGRPTTITRAAGTSMASTTSVTYNSGNAVITDSMNHQSTYTFDSQGRKTQLREPLNRVSYWTWNSDNQVTRYNTPGGGQIDTTYDSHGNPTETDTWTVLGSAKLVTTATYGFVGTDTDPRTYEPTSSVDENGHTTTYTYASDGQPTQVTTSSGTDKAATTAYAYNTNGTVATVTDPRSTQGSPIVTSYSYYSSPAALTGLLSQVTRPSLASVFYEYTLANQVAKQTDGNGVSTYSYDPMGRQTGGPVSYGYDGNGNETAMTDSTGTTTYTYDGLNDQLTKSFTPTGQPTPTQTAQYWYQLDGFMWKKQNNGNAALYTTYSEDAAGRVASMSDNQTGTVAFGYNGDDLQTSATHTLGGSTILTETTTYNVADQLLEKKSVNGANATITDFTYAYTNPSTGLPSTLCWSSTEFSPSTGVYTYYHRKQYDNADNLTQDNVYRDSGYTPPAFESSNYTYDLDHNMTMRQDPKTAGNMNLNYNAANEVSSSSVATYTYDGNGNRTSGGMNGATFTYNQINQPTQVTLNGTTNQIQYAGEGIRERTMYGSKTAQYDATGMTQSTNNGTTTFVSFSPDGAVAAELVNNSVYVYATDADGSVITLVDTNGGTHDHRRYTDTGIQLDPTSPDVANMFGYEGGVEDTDTGEVLAHSSIYDPNVGSDTANAVSHAYVVVGECHLDVTHWEHSGAFFDKYSVSAVVRCSGNPGVVAVSYHMYLEAAPGVVHEIVTSWWPVGEQTICSGVATVGRPFHCPTSFSVETELIGRFRWCANIFYEYVAYGQSYSKIGCTRPFHGPTT